MSLVKLPKGLVPVVLLCKRLPAELLLLLHVEAAHKNAAGTPLAVHVQHARFQCFPKLQPYVSFSRICDGGRCTGGSASFSAARAKSVLHS